MALTREEILAVDDKRIESVEVPEWPGPVFIRSMTAAGREAFERAFFLDERRRLREWMAIAAVCDESGAPLFSEADLEALGTRDAKALDRIYEAAARLNGLGGPDAAALESAAAGPATEGGS